MTAQNKDDIDKLIDEILEEPEQPTVVDETQAHETQEEEFKLPKYDPDEWVVLYKISFTLPSEFLAKLSARLANEDEQTKDIVISLFKSLAKKIDSIRSTIVHEIGKRFFRSEMLDSWFAIDYEGIKTVEELNKKVRDELMKIIDTGVVEFRDGARVKVPDVLRERLRAYVSKYSVRAVPIAIPPDVAEEVLKEAMAILKEGLDVLQARIEEAKKNQKENMLKKYRSEYNIKKMLYDALVKFYNEKFGGQSE